jgi:hypothetical protein
MPLPVRFPIVIGLTVATLKAQSPLGESVVAREAAKMSIAATR